MLPSRSIVALFLAIDVALAGSSFEDDITAFMSEMGDAVFSTPSKEVGSRVAQWSSKDPVNPEELGSYGEGDIIMPQSAVATSRNGLKSPSSRWKGGVVPYRIADSFNYKDYNTIMQAIEEYSKHTCVKWTRWAGEPDYVYFVSGNTGCWSSVGRVGGMQELNLQTPGCLTKKGTVIHEMMHALGFLHEQNRYERDSHVDIVWGNIQQGRQNNFQKASADTTDALGVEYDYRSVMHYSDHAFSANGGPTIVPKIKGIELGQRDGLSRSDVKKIRKMVGGMMHDDRTLVWNIAQEDLLHVPQHWFNQPAPHPLNNYLLGFLYFLFFIVAIIGNGLVLWIFSTAKPLRTPSNMFVVTLAFFDFCMMAKTPIMIFNSMNLGFVSGHFWCQVFAFVGSVTGIGAGATNACIAYDRYRTIAHPLDGKLTSGKAMLMCLLVWAYSLPWAILPLLEVWGRFVPEGYLTTCSFDYLSDDPRNQAFVGTMFIFSYILPMGLIIFFYSQIVSHVVAHEKALREQAKKMNVESLRSNQGSQSSQSAEIRIAKAAITICSLFVASWTPYAVIALIGSFGNRALITPGLAMIPACTCKAVACLDPYVYAISHPRYRAELEKRLPWLAGCVREPPETASNTTEATSAAATPA